MSSRIHVNFPLSSLYVASGKLGLVDLKETLEDGRRVYRVLSYELEGGPGAVTVKTEVDSRGRATG